MRHWLYCALLASASALGGIVPAQTVPQTAPTAAATAAPSDRFAAATQSDAWSADRWNTDKWNGESAADERGASYAWRQERHRNWRERREHANEVVSVGGDSHLEAGKKVDAVVSVFGSSTSDGEVSDSVVSVFGNTTVNGTTGEAVASFGNVTLNGKATGDVVAVFGDVTLGPNAEVGGDVVLVGGELIRAPSAVIHGSVETTFSGSKWVRAWIKHCLFLARPLAFSAEIAWAWALALGFLALYVLVAALLRQPVEYCVRVFEEHPGRSIVAALLAVLITPILILLVAVTVIGIPFVPVAILGALLINLLGRAVMLAWIGRRIIKGGKSPLNTALAVLTGGLIVLVLYVIPVVGFITYNLLGFVGFGVVVYALLQSLKARRNEQTAPPVPGGTSGPGAFPGGSAASAEAPAGAPGFAAGSAQSANASADATRSTTSTVEANLLALSTYPRATLWVRLAALLIDVVLVSLVLSLIYRSHEVVLLVLAAYGAVMWRLKGTTIGGIVFGLQVVRVDGQPVDWATAIVRALSCFLSLMVVGLGFIWIAIDPGRQAWHDKIAGTVVLRSPKGVSLL